MLVVQNARSLASLAHLQNSAASNVNANAWLQILVFVASLDRLSVLLNQRFEEFEPDFQGHAVGHVVE